MKTMEMTTMMMMLMNTNKGKNMKGNKKIEGKSQ